MSEITTMTDLMGEVVTLRQQLAEVTRLSDSCRMVMDHQATMLNDSVQQLAVMEKALVTLSKIGGGTSTGNDIARYALEEAKGTR
jgi:pyruvate-formate lyase